MGRLLCRRPFGLRRRALELVGSGHRGVWQHREAYRHIHRGGQLHRRIPGRLQSSAAVPCAPGDRGGLHLPRLSRPFGSIHGRDGQFHFAVARARDLYGSDAGLRDGARPPWLCVQRLAALCHGWLRLDPRPANPDANLERNDGRAFPLAVGLGRRRRGRGSADRELDGQARISVLQLRREKRRLSQQQRGVPLGFRPANGALGGELPFWRLRFGGAVGSGRGAAGADGRWRTKTA